MSEKIVQLNEEVIKGQIKGNRPIIPRLSRSHQYKSSTF